MRNKQEFLKNLNRGDIYLVKNNITGKCYVGQAKRYVSKQNFSWGTHGRWQSHINQALQGVQDSCRYLNNAIRKYGTSAFTVYTLFTCDNKDLTHFEQVFMQQYNTIYPNGYNIREAGNGIFVNGMKVPDREGERDGEIHAKKQRSRSEDDDLPKYICSLRDNDVIIGYRIVNFPTDEFGSNHITKVFGNKGDPKKALEDAKNYLHDLYIKYYSVRNTWENGNAEREKQLADKKIAKLYECPDDFIYPIVVQAKVQGYQVKGLKDRNGNEIPPKDFNDCQLNRWNLSRAKKYIEQVRQLVTNNVNIEDWSNVDTVYKRNKQGITHEHLPKYINITTYKGEKNGYVVNGYPLPDGKKSCKKFTKSKYKMEERYNQAIAYLQELKQKYPINT